MASNTAVGTALLVLFANIALPIQAASLPGATTGALMRRADGGAAAGAAGRRTMVAGADGSIGAAEVEDGTSDVLTEEEWEPQANEMADLQLLISQHAESETELHAAGLWHNVFSKYKREANGCGHQGGMMPCPEGQVCTYTEQQGGVSGIDITVEKRGALIRLMMEIDSEVEDSILQHVTMYMTTQNSASPKDAPAILMHVSGGFLENSNANVMLKVLLVKDGDNVTQACPSNRELVETQGDTSLSFTTTNTSMTITDKGPHAMFLGMSFTLVGQEPSPNGAFQVPAGLKIQTISREEMITMLTSQMLPASVKARIAVTMLEGRDESGDEDDMLGIRSRRRGVSPRRRRASTGGSRIRSRRRRRGCSRTESGSMVGGAVGMAAAFGICVFAGLFGCMAVAPVVFGLSAAAVTGGACSCWQRGDDWFTSTGCALR